MSVGDSIFLSAVLLAIVGLYAATKDRWNWRRIAKWLVGVPIVLIVFAGFGLWGYKIYEDRPTPQIEFGSIRLGESMAEVRFRKGEPSKKIDDNVWQYDDVSSTKADEAMYVVMFKNGKVRSVRYFGSKIYNPYLLGFTKGSHYDEVIAKLGAPTHTSTSKNGLRRLLSFEKYKVVYGFEQAKVEVYGVYDPTEGPLRFADEANDSTSPAPETSK